MKNFFKKLFGKKYPERNDGPSTRHGRVYAGPGYFRSRTEGVYAGPPRRDDEEFTCVYMGPPEDLDPPVEDVVLEEVYNGPGMMGELGWGSEIDEPVEEPNEEPEPGEEPAEADVKPDAEPAGEPDAAPAENADVTTESDSATVTKQPEDDPEAPEFIDDAEEPTFDNEREDEDDFRDKPDYDPYNDPRTMAAYMGPSMPPQQMSPVSMIPDNMKLVYAGPVINNNQKPVNGNPYLAQTMMAYFGPGGPNGPAVPGVNMMMGMMNATQEPTPDPSVEIASGPHKVCSMCGKMVHANSKFCPDCGMPMADEPVLEGIKNDPTEEGSDSDNPGMEE